MRVDCYTNFTVEEAKSHISPFVQENAFEGREFYFFNRSLVPLVKR